MSISRFFLHAQEIEDTFLATDRFNIDGFTRYIEHNRYKGSPPMVQRRILTSLLVARVNLATEFIYYVLIDEDD
ncbi:MAG: hypothetical protein HKP41_16920 [Desulfobacterales bacterium]|nr:hypothetical protein [Desulfobacterales bacterium]